MVWYAMNVKSVRGYLVVIETSPAAAAAETMEIVRNKMTLNGD